MKEAEYSAEMKARIDSFDKELLELQKKYKLRLYAANQLQSNGEVQPIIKVMPFLEFNEKAYDENQTKEGDSTGKKAQPNRPKK